MNAIEPNPPDARRDLLRWTASLGAVTAEALAVRRGVSLASARARLAAARRAGLLSRSRPLAERPALYTLTARGMHIEGVAGSSKCRVSASNAAHLIECALAAAVLERCYPGHRALGERELRAAERACGCSLASARLRGVDGWRLALHRPDLVLVPATGEPRGAVAVEVELSVKAPRRLREICRAWARCREVAGVLYLVSEEVEPAVSRAVAAAGACERVAVVRLASLPALACSATASATAGGVVARESSQALSSLPGGRGDTANGQGEE